MKLLSLYRQAFLFSIFSLAIGTGTVSGSIISSGPISEMNGSTGVFPAGDTTFNLTAADIPNVEFLADFSIVDAGVEIVVNGTPLFPQFFDISQFGPVPVFANTGEPNGGGVNLPFNPNNNSGGLPRLTVNSTSAGTVFSGATFPNDTQTTIYDPVFTVQDFSSLLVAGSNTVEFFALNGFDDTNLQGDFTVSLNAPPAEAVPEPGMAGFAILALVAGWAKRRRSC